MAEQQKFKKVAIIGLGLIGGSLAYDLKGKKLAETVIGISRREEVISQAKAAGAIDWGTTDLQKGVREAELVFICQPVLAIVETLKKIIRFLRPETMVTDVGSTKKMILDEAAKICPEGVYFIGGHPMAGSEKGGFVAARPDLFQKAVYILTPLPQTPVNILENFSALVEKLGASVVYLEPEEHDRMAAAVSHLPYLTAVALVKSILTIPRYQEFLKFAAGGFRDTTRIAASPPDVWKDICLSNRKEIIKFLGRLEKEIAALKKILENNEATHLEKILTEASLQRQNFFD